MDYNKKRKMNHNLLNIVTFFVVVFNLFPILWMVYTSLMSNNDVMMGEISMSHRENDGVFITSHNDNIILGTNDGAISSYSIEKNLENLEYLNTNSFCPSFAEDNEFIWMFTADKGLIKVDKNTFKKETVLSFNDMISAYEKKSGSELPKMYVTDMIRTSIISFENEVIIGFWNDQAYGLTIVDKKSLELTFVTESDGLKSTKIKQFVEVSDKKLSILTGAGIEVLDLSTNKIVDVVKTIDREDFDFVSFIDENTLAGCSMTARSILIYERRGNYFYRVFEISEKTGINISKVTSLYVEKENKKLVFGTATTGEIFKIKYDSQVVVNDSIQPSEEAPVEEADAKKAFVFDTVNFEVIKNKITGPNDILVIYEKGNDLYTAGDKGHLTLINKEVNVSTVAPEGSLYIHWRNYIDVFKNIDFGLYLKNSLIICTSVMVIAMFLASLAGYSLSRYKFPGKDAFGYSILATQMVPGIMFLIPIYLMFVKFNELTGIPVKGTYWSIIFTYSAFFVPFSIWILRGFFASIPKELEEAALIDGCNPFQAFFKIIIPAAMPGIVATGIYVFLLAWDELMFAWILTNENTYTIPVGIRNFAGNYQNRYDLMMAAATIATVPVMVLFFMMQKQIVSGLTSGAVKE